MRRLRQIKKNMSRDIILDVGLLAQSLFSSRVSFSLDRKPPMPYRVWESKLKKRVGMWYHQARERHSGLINTLKAQYQLGLDPTFFDILGAHANPLEKKQFHELSFFQRVWILKGLCDNCLV